MAIVRSFVCGKCGGLNEQAPGKGRPRKYCKACTPNRFVYWPSCVIYPRQCDQCATWYISRRPNGTFCTETCRNRRRDQSRARKGRASPELRRAVLDRDGWRCHLCGKKIPRRPFKNHPMDPTVDHLIPRSAGGDNAMSNLAAAHHGCNASRQEFGAAQLRLIA